ncbi:MAG TPA: hypothetical protein VHN39_01600, partial [Phenylobacterium sp.]|nr:hypothetical protein [Phenylobacterium sp.]
MSRAPQSIFREAAIDRLSSPDQLDQIVGVTRPVDWMAAAVVALAILMLLVWSVVGAIPTRVAGDGIVLGSGGKVADAAASAGGRLRTVFVTVGDRLAQLHPIADRHEDRAKPAAGRGRRVGDLAARAQHNAVAGDARR